MRVLYVENNAAFAKRKMQELRDEADCNPALLGIEIVHVSDYGQAAAALEKKPVDLVISDFRFPGRDSLSRSGGMNLLQHVQLGYPRIPFFFFSDHDVFTIAHQTRASRLTIRDDHIYNKKFKLSDIISFTEYLNDLAKGGDVPKQDPKPDTLTRN